VVCDTYVTRTAVVIAMTLATLPDIGASADGGARSLRYSLLKSPSRLADVFRSARERARRTQLESLQRPTKGQGVRV